MLPISNYAKHVRGQIDVFPSVYSKNQMLLAQMNTLPERQISMRQSLRRRRVSLSRLKLLVHIARHPDSREFTAHFISLAKEVHPDM